MHPAFRGLPRRRFCSGKLCVGRTVECRMSILFAHVGKGTLRSLPSKKLQGGITADMAHLADRP